MEMTFGDWLKRRRQQLDFTQKELAYQANCGLGTLRKIENGSRRPSKALAAAIGRALHIPREEMPAFVKFARSTPDPFQLLSFAQEQIIPPQVKIPKPKAPYVSPRPRLPQQQFPIIGRERELNELQQLLTNSTSLVNIIGPGGMGKTRLALEVAHNLANQFDDGAAFVRLAPLTSHDSVVFAIARAIHIELQEGAVSSPREQLLRQLEQKRLLVVLDNYDHLLDDVSLLIDIVKSASNVRVLVTSRERLKLQVEQVYPLHGLVLTKWQTIEEARQDPAVQLFLYHARHVRPNFSLRQKHLPSLQEIFRLVGGMPLAIILAAGWVEVLSPAQIHAEISHNLELLEATMRDIPDRHQSMRAVFDGTWNRLKEIEQKIFAALSVFRGGFTLEAAREVTQATPHNLMKLVDQSLLIRGKDGRFEIHELLRQFAAIELARNPYVEDSCRRKHSAFYCRFMAERENDLKGHRVLETIAEIELDYENVHAAWRWAAINEVEELLSQAINSLGYYHHRVSKARKAVKLFREIIEIISGAQDHSLASLASLHSWLSLFVVYIHKKPDFQEGERLARQALAYLDSAAAQGIDVRRYRAHAYHALGYSQRRQPLKAWKNLENSLALYKELGMTWDQAFIHMRLAVPLVQLANYNLVEEHNRKARELFELNGDHKNSVTIQARAAVTHLRKGKLVEAEAGFQHCLNWCHENNHEGTIFHRTIRIGLAELMIYTGRFNKALTMLENIHPLPASWNYFQRNMFITWTNLHLGRYEQLLDDAPLLIAADKKRGFPPHIGFRFVALGFAALAGKRFELAQNYFGKSIATLENIQANENLTWAKVGLAYLALSEGYTITANSHLTNVFQSSIDNKLFWSILFAIPAVSLLLIEYGAGGRAIELYTLACTHDFVANSQLFYDIAGQKIDAHTAALPPNVVTAAQEHGRSLDLIQTAESLLQELTTNQPN